MNKKPILYALAAVVAILILTDREVVANDPKPLGPQTEEYISIIYGGRFDTHIIRPGGKAEFQNLSSVNFPERIDRAQEQHYLMHLTIEKCAKEGFTVVDFINAGYVVMGRKVGQ